MVVVVESEIDEGRCLVNLGFELMKSEIDEGRCLVNLGFELMSTIKFLANSLV